MELVLSKKPKGVTIIEGFRGFGLVSTIATEYVIDHLNAEQIGKIVFEEAPPLVAVHSGAIIEPIGIFYSKKYNLVILHALTSIAGFEWQIAKKVTELAKQLQAKEIVCVEGVGSTNETANAFYLSEKNGKRFEKIGITKLKEGIILGVTGALMLENGLNVSCIFTETHSNLPDSRAAAKIIETLDNYLGLKIDPKPLIKKAENFEAKIKSLMEQGAMASKESKEKELS